MVEGGIPGGKEGAIFSLKARLEAVGAKRAAEAKVTNASINTAAPVPGIPVPPLSEQPLAGRIAASTEMARKKAGADTELKSPDIITDVTRAIAHREEMNKTVAAKVTSGPPGKK